MEIGVIGVGKLGLCFALLLEKNGFNVLCSDINDNYVDKINNKILKTLEPEVNELLFKSKNLFVTTDNLDLIKKTDIIFTFVQTPSDENGEYNHSNVENIVNQFFKLSELGFDLTNKIFVIGCTTMPNYSNSVFERLQKIGVHVCYNPEFIAQGEIIKGLETADMVLIGSSSEYASNKLKEIYKRIMVVNPTFNIMSNTAAEITKIAINCFLTSKISFANMIGETCILSGIDNEINKVLVAIGNDSRIGEKYLKFGYGFGGPCLPRDNKALGKHMEKISLNVNLPYEIDNFNKNHNQFLYETLINQNSDKNIPFIFDSISYKKGVDIITESQQLKLSQTLLNNGYKVIIIDLPQVIDLIKDEFILKYGDNVTLDTENNYRGYNVNI